MTRYVNDWKVSWTTPDSDDPEREEIDAASRAFRARLTALAESWSTIWPELRIDVLDGVEQPETDDDPPDAKEILRHERRGM